MIRKQKLTREELNDLQEGAIITRIALPMVMIGFSLFFVWVLGIPWPIFWFMAVFILVLSLYAYFAGGKQEMKIDIDEGVKLIRSGTITDVNVELLGPRKPVIEYINITLEKEASPEPYPQHHVFCIYNSNSSLYLSDDKSLPKRYKTLKGQLVEVEYFPYSGKPLAFREEDK